jgi:hypothetical protein
VPASKVLQAFRLLWRIHMVKMKEELKRVRVSAAANHSGITATRAALRGVTEAGPDLRYWTALG